MSDKANFRTRKIIRDKIYIMIEESIHQEDIAILNMCVPNKIPSKFMRQKLMERKGEIDKFTIIVANFNMTLLIIYTSFRQNIIKYVDNLNDTINQLDLIVRIYILLKFT